MALSVSIAPSSFTKASYTCPPGCWVEKELCYCPDARTTARIAKAQAFRGLGMIPDFQFHTAPYNPEGYNWTSKLKFTKDVPNQLTVQPVGPYVTSGETDLQGLGVTMVQKLDGAFDSWWWTNRKWLALGAVSLVGLIGLGLATKVIKK